MVKSSPLPKTQAPLWLIRVTNRLLLTLPLQIPFDILASYQLLLSVSFLGFWLLRLRCPVHPPTLLLRLIGLPLLNSNLSVWIRKKLNMECKYEIVVNPSLQVLQNYGLPPFSAYKYAMFKLNSYISYYFDSLSNNWFLLLFLELCLWCHSLKQTLGLNGMDKGKVGEPKEFPRLFAKLRMEWKPLKGTMTFNTLKAGWFEIIFSNQADFLLIWANRPYHLFSQLLLIKQWYPGFDPTTTESISQLDLWVRLHYLTEEFANGDALETIIEGNYIGKFLKMDPTHNSERWNMFTRFCINTDIEKTFGKGVIIPDEHLNQIKLTLWFDDFSPGCVACGKSGHVYKDCPSKSVPTPTLQIKLKKPSTKLMMEAGLCNEDFSHLNDWNLMGKNNKPIHPSTNYTFPSNNIYLSGKGGINIIYESDDSDEAVQQILLEEEILEQSPTLIAASDGLFPNNSILENKEKNDMTHWKEINATHMAGETSKMAHQDMLPNKKKNKGPSGTADVFYQKIGNKDKVIQINSAVINNGGGMSAKNQETVQKIGDQAIHVTAAQIIQRNDAEDLQSQNPHDESEEYEEELFDYEYDDLLMDEPQQFDTSTLPLLNIPETEMKPILISDDPSFSEKDLEDFINNEQIGIEANGANSENSFHSMQNSIHSSSSFAVKLGALAMNNADNSNSTSSKRKGMDGTEDTASSDAKEGKKPRK